MPTYEYHCDACEHHFDEFQSIKDEPLVKCPQCGRKKLRRVFGTGAAILFKGSGFYETDYRSESYKKAAKADQEAASKASGTGGTGSANGTNGTAGTNGASKGGGAGKGTKGESKSSKS
jgi:putative FmdB family regulatory protein